MPKRVILAVTALLLVPLAALQAAELKLATPFSSHLVLQRDMPVPVWGWAPARSEVTVSFKSQRKSTRADADGRWRGVLFNCEFDEKSAVAPDDFKQVVQSWREAWVRPGLPFVFSESVMKLAKAEISGARVILTAAGLAQSAFVRLAWTSDSNCNLINSDGLPAMPFTAALSVPAGAAETSAAAAPPVEIARFAGNRVAAVSYTFDDGTMGHYTVAAPALERYGFRGTFGVVVRKTADDPEAAEKLAAAGGKSDARRISWKEWRELVARGHEVANHGLDHRGLPALTEDELEREVEGARRIITEKVGRPLTFIYPGNGRNPRVRDFVLKNHIAARDREERFGGSGFNVEKANGIVDKAIKTGQFIVVMMHAVAEVGYQPVSKDELEGHLQYVSKLKDHVWVDTLANVSRYVRERDAAKVTIKVSAANRVTFDVASPLSPGLFNGPLTCVINAGDHAISASAQCVRDGAMMPAVISGNNVLVEVAPGTGDVTVWWTNNP